MIEVQNLSKLYKLGSIGSTTLRESLNRAWYRIIGKEELGRRIGEKDLMIPPDHPQAGPEPNTFWALKDVSFTVEQGDIVGIIGRNGAGKSTLLKVLTRITEPTSGRAVLRGRVGSLLEVGTGFHPELTGRENIFLNGAILGMRRREIERKFDEIVAFAEVERFIDTPVKRYSSGMYVRLAFAVAAHLDPEILLVDEVLAVGDAEFQKKCLGKMKDVAGEGRTVLFVSHNMAAVQTLCLRALLLQAGSIIASGPAQDIVVAYEDSLCDSRSEATHCLRAVGQGDSGRPTWPRGEELLLEVTCPADIRRPGWECDLAFYTPEGIKVFAVRSRMIHAAGRPHDEGVITFAISNPGFGIRPLRVDLGIRTGPGSGYAVLQERCLTVYPLPAAHSHNAGDALFEPPVRLITHDCA